MVEISTQSVPARHTTQLYSNIDFPASSTTSYIVVGLGACLSVPIIVYAIYIVYRHRKRHGYIDLDKAMASIKTASPRESESQDADRYFESSTESDIGKSSGEEIKPATFYIGADSEEEMMSKHFVTKAYLPKVHIPKKRKPPRIHCIISV